MSKSPVAPWCQPACAYLRPVGRVSIAALLTLAVAGCATSQTYNAARSAAGAPSATPAGMAAMPRKPPVVELEDDGMPVQVAPYRRTVREADDPAEPFSPNYGTRPGQNSPVARRVEERHAGAAPPAPRVYDYTATGNPSGNPSAVAAAEDDRIKSVSYRRLTPAEAQAVIAAAIAAHEHRKP